MKFSGHKTPALFDQVYVARTAEVTSTMPRLELNSNGKSLVKASRSDHRRKRLKH
jgi:hypothetical protein